MLQFDVIVHSILSKRRVGNGWTFFLSFSQKQEIVPCVNKEVEIFIWKLSQYDWSKRKDVHILSQIITYILHILFIIAGYYNAVCAVKIICNFDDLMIWFKYWNWYKSYPKKVGKMREKSSYIFYINSFFSWLRCFF